MHHCADQLWERRWESLFSADESTLNVTLAPKRVNILRHFKTSNSFNIPIYHIERWPQGISSGEGVNIVVPVWIFKKKCIYFFKYRKHSSGIANQSFQERTRPQPDGDGRWWWWHEFSAALGPREADAAAPCRLKQHGHICMRWLLTAALTALCSLAQDTLLFYPTSEDKLHLRTLLLFRPTMQYF